MHPQHPDPVDVVRRVYEAFFAVDLDAVAALAHPDVVLAQDEALPWGGRYVGREGVAEFARRLYGTVESTVTPEAVFRAGDQVVQYGRSRGSVRASGRPFDVPECHVWTVRDGRVADVTMYVDTPAMLAVLQ